MDGKTVPRDRLKLRDDPAVISPPIVRSPLYACATAVTVVGFIPNAEIELEIGGTTLAPQPATGIGPHGQC